MVFRLSAPQGTRLAVHFSGPEWPPSRKCKSVDLGMLDWNRNPHQDVYLSIGIPNLHQSSTKRERMKSWTLTQRTEANIPVGFGVPICGPFSLGCVAWHPKPTLNPKPILNRPIQPIQPTRKKIETLDRLDHPWTPWTGGSTKHERKSKRCITKEKL